MLNAKKNIPHLTRPITYPNKEWTLHQSARIIRLCLQETEYECYEQHQTGVKFSDLYVFKLYFICFLKRIRALIIPS